jgi:ElaB/YqjD/DUF883 family membrane-anchored ribosome-binding protein
MINPNGDEFTESDSSTSSRIEEEEQRASDLAGDVWTQPRPRMRRARERTEFFLRENPIPTVLGALAVGLAIGLAIRYSSESREPERQLKTPLGNIDLGVLSLPFLWPLFKSVKRRYDDSADAVMGGVDRLRSVDVDRYVKPLRKKWRSWTN